MVVATNFWKKYKYEEREEIYNWCDANSIFAFISDQNKLNIDDEHAATLFLIRWAK